jgi:Gpi18-like mannosyltransferase
VSASSTGASSVAETTVDRAEASRETTRQAGGWRGLLLVLAIGLVVRAVLAAGPGHHDLGWYVRWTRSLHAGGLKGLYRGDGPICDYPPLYVLTMRAVAAISSWADPALEDEARLRAVLRGPAYLADVAIALLLFWEGRRLLEPRGGVAAAALYFLNPATVYLTGYWGQTDSIHACFALGACVALNRRRSWTAGLMMALAILQKLQAIVFVPLLVLDLYRQRRWRGVSRGLAGTAVAAVAVLAPFVLTKTARDVLTRGYVKVVGQYPYRSFYAFNLWYLSDQPGARDDTVPAWLVPVAAHNGRPLEASHWVTWLTWRRLALGLFALTVAAILAVYSRHTTPGARLLTAGLLALTFFLVPTQMHERYLFPALAVLPLWAVGGAWRERAYALVSVAFLLNLTVVMPPGGLSRELAVVLLLVAATLLIVFYVTARPPSEVVRASPVDVPGSRPEPGPRLLLESPEPLVPLRLICWYRRLTVVAFVIAVALGAWVAVRNIQFARWARHRTDVVYLSALTPVRHQQGYGRLRRDASVDGSALALGDRLFPRGLGTHAPFELVYDLPAGFSRFVATVGLNRYASGLAVVDIFLDDRRVQTCGPLRASDPPSPVAIPLAGARQLRLVGLDLGDKTGDQIDLAEARLER